MTTVQDIIDYQADSTAIKINNVPDTFDKTEFEKIAIQISALQEDKLYHAFIYGCFYADNGRTPETDGEYYVFTDKLESLDIDTGDLCCIFHDCGQKGYVGNLTKAAYAGYLMYPLYVEQDKMVRGE